MSQLPQDFCAFICELDKLKRVKRQITLPCDDGRQENSAEHSWHVALMAITLAEFAKKTININRVIRMILIHDVVEIDAGDLFAFNSDSEHTKQAVKERIAAKRIFGMLPNPLGAELLDLWLEFEDASTPDAEFARAMDRVLPVLQNMSNNGGSWKKHGITREKIEQRNLHLKTCAPELWNYVSQQLDRAVAHGWLISSS